MARLQRHTRRGARELAFQVLYGLTFSPAADAEALRRAFVLSPHNLDMSEADLHEEPTGFAWELVDGVWRTTPRLDAALARLSHNWRVNRMGRVELTLLRLAMYELLAELAPARVVINEALELAAQFGGENARSFINGLLDAAARAGWSPEDRKPFLREPPSHGDAAQAE